MLSLNIVVIDKGVVVETGKHDAKGGLYATLWNKQSGLMY
jgi:ABC-type transport system involved in Fe-S cluster assembly fused permease/ATPase subunit